MFSLIFDPWCDVHGQIMFVNVMFTIHNTQLASLLQCLKYADATATVIMKS